MKKDKCKSCEDNVIDGFIESVEEEIRNENWQILWNKYGKIVTYAATALIVSAGVYSFWQKKDLEEREAISARFSKIQSILMSGNIDSAASQLKEISMASKKNYATLAKFEYATVLHSKNDKAAISQYKAIFEDKKVDSIFRDIAYIFHVNASLDFLSPKEILENVDAFTQELSTKYSNSPWKLFALESVAFCHIKVGKNDEARAVLESLIKTTGVPSDMLERAKILIQSISE